ncbi:biofilm regulation diguanylate cyclase SiaD [Methylogaea oryzae]|uniref:diguanylate cyclase n=1 Tax=Methylogaea oryzae TaxID=1295382 RepID=A0A8D4VNF9_9GAMM|nr:biofilm regulation diguanylate cyclase SiaD [Methylogaea oryzae]BBL71103.1 GGDEF domain-containing protein [Methylogaea oryzae]
MRKGHDIEQTVETLLADPQYDGHPLHQALADLYKEFQQQVKQIDRVTRISDHYQSAARETNLSLSDRCRRQLKYLEKVARISDGYQSLMRDRQETLREESLRDSLTGLGNRRMLQNRLKAEASRLDRYRLPLTLVMVDVDHFKAINDTHGHDAGDKVLATIARVFEAGLRDYDICGRWGGEEFLIIMPEQASDVAGDIVERLRQTVESTNIRIGEQVIGVTASFGIAHRHPGEDVAETLQRADQALLTAKRAGRNRCETAN